MTAGWDYEAGAEALRKRLDGYSPIVACRMVARAVIDAATENVECWKCYGTGRHTWHGITSIAERRPCPNPHCVEGRVRVLRREA